MLHITKNQNNFSQALKTVRRARGLSQEAFSQVSSRTYVSSLERGLKSPTISKVDELSEVMNTHPLTLLSLSYLKDKELISGDKKEIARLLEVVSKELHAILACE